MYRYGPLVRFWCMRFEGKHNYFKDLAHRLKCFKNISKTMAYRHQELVCYYVNSGSDCSPFCKESKTGPGTCMYMCTYILIRSLIFPTPNAATTSVVNALKYKETILAEFPDITEESEVTRYVVYMYNLATK